MPNFYFDHRFSFIKYLIYTFIIGIILIILHTIMIYANKGYMNMIRDSNDNLSAITVPSDTSLHHDQYFRQDKYLIYRMSEETRHFLHMPKSSALVSSYHSSCPSPLFVFLKWTIMFLQQQSFSDAVPDFVTHLQRFLIAQSYYENCRRKQVILSDSTYSHRLTSTNRSFINLLQPHRPAESICHL